MFEVPDIWVQIQTGAIHCGSSAALRFGNPRILARN